MEIDWSNIDSIVTAYTEDQKAYEERLKKKKLDCRTRGTSSAFENQLLSTMCQSTTNTMDQVLDAFGYQEITIGFRNHEHNSKKWIKQLSGLLLNLTRIERFSAQTEDKDLYDRTLSFIEALLDLDRVYESKVIRDITDQPNQGLGTGGVIRGLQRFLLNKPIVYKKDDEELGSEAEDASAEDSVLTSLDEKAEEIYKRRIQLLKGLFNEVRYFKTKKDLFYQDVLQKEAIENRSSLEIFAWIELLTESETGVNKFFEDLFRFLEENPGLNSPFTFTEYAQKVLGGSRFGHPTHNGFNYQDFFVALYPDYPQRVVEVLKDLGKKQAEIEGFKADTLSQLALKQRYSEECRKLDNESLITNFENHLAQFNVENLIEMISHWPWLLVVLEQKRLTNPKQDPIRAAAEKREKLKNPSDLKKLDSEVESLLRVWWNRSSNERKTDLYGDDFVFVYRKMSEDPRYAEKNEYQKWGEQEQAYIDKNFGAYKKKSIQKLERLILDKKRSEFEACLKAYPNLINDEIDSCSVLYYVMKFKEPGFLSDVLDAIDTHKVKIKDAFKKDIFEFAYLHYGENEYLFKKVLNTLDKQDSSASRAVKPYTSWFWYFESLLVCAYVALRSLFMHTLVLYKIQMPGNENVNFDCHWGSDGKLSVYQIKEDCRRQVQDLPNISFPVSSKHGCKAVQLKAGDTLGETEVRLLESGLTFSRRIC